MDPRDLLGNPKERQYRREIRAFNWTRRSTFYAHLATQVGNAVPIKSALTGFLPRLERENTAQSKRVKKIVLSILHAMNDGHSFADSLKRWIPNEEMALISSGELSGRLPDSLETIIDAQERVNRVRQAAVGAMVAPTVYIGVVFLFLWAIGTQVVPALAQALPKAKARGSVWVLYTLGDIAGSAWAFVPLVLLALAIVAVRWSLPRWGGKNRIFAERFLPYSFYRDMHGFSWLMGLASLLRAGVTDVKILEYQIRTANPWLKERLRDFHRFMQDGKSLSEALISKTQSRPPFGFPNPNIVDDIASFDGFHDFPEKVMARARKWANTLEESTQAFAKRIGFAVEMVLYAVMFFLVYASNELSEQLGHLPGAS